MNGMGCPALRHKRGWGRLGVMFAGQLAAGRRDIRPAAGAQENGIAFLAQNPLEGFNPLVRWPPIGEIAAFIVRQQVYLAGDMA